MAVISQPAALLSENLSVFYTADPLLSNSPILAFYGASTTSIANPANNSRIQCHIFTAAGLRSYPRLAVSPGSTLYQAVNCLSREEQGDDVCRGLAFSLLKYFTELPESAKSVWIEDALSTDRPSSALKLFSDSHAANLASHMQQVVNAANVINDVRYALSDQSISYLDTDLVLPAGSINAHAEENGMSGTSLQDDDLGFRYGRYASLLRQFGEPLFIPTSKIRRAPSKTTSVSHSASTSPEQTSKLWRQMCELVTTEENYVQKIDQLVNGVGKDFKKAIKDADADTSICNKIFTPTLETILSLNMVFLTEVQNILQEAARKTSELEKDERRDRFAQDVNVSGIVTFAQCLRTSVSQFKDSYGEYIEGHATVSRLVKDTASMPESTLGRVVLKIGERRLLSMLIEPVQRLPRYSLYIDNMIRYLPAGHPAVSHLLSTKDIVAAICSQDSASLDHGRLSRLGDIIRSWPTSLPSSSRLVALVDATELDPPYSLAVPRTLNASSILLLFTNFLVVIRRQSDRSPNARTLLADLDSPVCQSDRESLTVAAWWMLTTIDFSESQERACVVISPSAVCQSPTIKMQATRSSATPPQTRVFKLVSVYEGQADRLLAEVAKARIEDRHTEASRESPKWEARSSKPKENSLGLLTAIFEDAATSSLLLQSRSASLRILVDPGTCHSPTRSLQSDGGILAIIVSEDQGLYKLALEAPHERSTSEVVTLQDLLPVLLRRVSSLLHMRYQMRNPAVAVHLYQRHQTILRSLKLKFHQVQPVSRTIRSHSPVKAISSLFSSSVSSKDSARASVVLQQSPVLYTPLQPVLASHPSFKAYSPATGNKLHEREDSKVTLVEFDLQPESNVPFNLESTFSTYIQAIRAYKGDITGKIVARRALVPEAQVNELCNVLLDNPSNAEKAAQAPVDLLFAAFEKFLRGAWKQTMGSVIDEACVAKLESASAMSSAHDREQHISSAIRQLSPQNQRALRAALALIFDLLSGTTNDGDKGFLTAAFAELLLEEYDTKDSIPVLERLLQIGTSLDLSATRHTDSLVSSCPGATRTTHTGSISSKAASFTKRLGFGSLRKDHSKVDFLPSGSIRRKTVDDGRPAAKLVFSDENRDTSMRAQCTPQAQRQRAVTGSDEDTFTLDPIAVSPFTTTLNPFSSPLSPRKARPMSTTAIVPGDPVSPKSLSPSKLPRPQSLHATGTTRNAPPKYELDLRSSVTTRALLIPKKDNSLSVDTYATIRGRPQQLNQTHANLRDVRLASSDTPDFSPSDKFAMKKSPSPGLRGVLCERNKSVNSMAQPSSPVKYFPQTSASPVKKLRIKSPVKSQPKSPAAVIETPVAGDSLQDELASLSSILISLSQELDSPAMVAVATRLQDLKTALEPASNILPGNILNTRSRIGNSNSLVAEQQIKQLKAQLARADSENAALYDRTNKELMGMFEQVRSGNGVHELRQRLGEEMDEAKKWREEAKKLVRENAMLKASLQAERIQEADTSSTEELLSMVQLEPIVDDDYAAHIANRSPKVKKEENNMFHDDNEGYDHDMVRTKENQPPVLRSEKSMSIMGRGRPRAHARNGD